MAKSLQAIGDKQTWKDGVKSCRLYPLILLCHIPAKHRRFADTHCFCNGRRIVGKGLEMAACQREEGLHGAHAADHVTDRPIKWHTAFWTRFFRGIVDHLQGAR